MMPNNKTVVKVVIMKGFKNYTVLKLKPLAWKSERVKDIPKMTEKYISTFVILALW